MRTRKISILFYHRPKKIASKNRIREKRLWKTFPTGSAAWENVRKRRTDVCKTGGLLSVSVTWRQVRLMDIVKNLRRAKGNERQNHQFVHLYQEKKPLNQKKLPKYPQNKIWQCFVVKKLLIFSVGWCIISPDGSMPFCCRSLFSWTEPALPLQILQILQIERFNVI